MRKCVYIPLMLNKDISSKITLIRNNKDHGKELHDTT